MENIFGDQRNEIEAIEEFIIKNSTKYQFEIKEIKKPIEKLLQQRLYNQQWIKKSEKIHFLKILQFARLITRDKAIMDLIDIKQFVDTILSILTEYISKHVNHHFYEEEISQEIILELISICKRLINNEYMLKKFFTEKIFILILELIEIKHAVLLRCALEFLIFLYDAIFQYQAYKQELLSEFLEVQYLGKLLIILESYQTEYKALALNLLSKIVENEHAISVLRKYFGFTTLINTMNTVNQINIKIALLNIMKMLINTEENIVEFKNLGAINLFLFQLRNSKNLMESILLMTNLSQMCLDNECSIKIHDQGLLILLKNMMNFHPLRRNQDFFEDVQEQETDNAYDDYLLYLFRCIRYIFSLERNRKIIKQVFPPRLFAVFYDVGNFVKDLPKYEIVLKEFENMAVKDIESIESQLKDTSKMQQISVEDSYTRKVGQYTILQQIGKGAFGIVYLGKKGENEYAIKELKLSDFDNKANQVNGQGEDISKEVRIYKELSHPNIIKYYESFIENDFLYIVMEYVDGFSLSDLIKLQAEKGSLFKENQIWSVLINLAAVLKYLHHEKNILHRDISPANILIDRNFKVKLADFGLAKKLNHAASNLKSFVGTLIYTCPEIVQNKPYSEKADIWSFGCLLYEMVTLKSAFSSNNPLLLAKKIVDNDYEKLDSKYYSKELISFINACMTYEESKRPSILELIRYISDKILDYTNKISENEENLRFQISGLKKKIKEINDMKITEAQDTKTKTIKIDPQNLAKLKNDPISNYTDILKKISCIVFSEETKKNLKRDYKKYLIELFFKRVIANPKMSSNMIKLDVNKVILYAKEEISCLKNADGQFDLANLEGASNEDITYEKLHFYIDEKYDELLEYVN